VEPLRLGAVVFGAAFLAQRLQDRLHRGGALGGEVAGDPAGVVQGGVEPQVPLAVPAVIVAGVVAGVWAPGPPINLRAAAGLSTFRDGRRVPRASSPNGATADHQPGRPASGTCSTGRPHRRLPHRDQARPPPLCDPRN
jgi:hypothetical protein